MVHVRVLSFVIRTLLSDDAATNLGTCIQMLSNCLLYCCLFSSFGWESVHLREDISVSLLGRKLDSLCGFDILVAKQYCPLCTVSSPHTMYMCVVVTFNDFWLIYYCRQTFKHPF